MKDLWTKAALGAVALVCAGAANAFVIDFESGVTTANASAYPLLGGGDSVSQGGFNIIGQDATNATGTLVGALVNGGDATTCPDGVCPSGNTGHYITGLNDGIISVQTAAHTPLLLTSFSAAFLPSAGVAYSSGQVAYLAVEADDSAGHYAVGLYVLNGPSAATGTTSFTTFSTSSYISNGSTGNLTLTSPTVTSLFFYAYYCSGTTCSGFSTDKADFALDNITVSAVPEPSEWLLMAAGLGAVGAVVRRRRAA